MKKLIVCIIALGAFAVSSHAQSSPGTVTIKGEVLDMACYLDHGAQGEKHAACAAKCIRSGLPVGIKAEDGQVYLLIGQHKPINDQIAEFAGKTITVQGKLANRDGINLLENASIVQQ
jgi:type 1 fimbria pilin